jgi:hypothetical protein
VVWCLFAPCAACPRAPAPAPSASPFPPPPPHHTPPGVCACVFVCVCVQELELLLMQNRKYCAEIASAVSAAKRREIALRAEQLNIRVTNAHAKLREEENE